MAWVHGTINGYENGCRCEGCTASGGIPHGTVSGYTNWRCRCDECTPVGRDYYRERGEHRRYDIVTRLESLDRKGPPGEWAQQGACVGENPDLWYPSTHDDDTIALQLCASCPVRGECLEYGLDEKYGIWGGMKERPRRRLRSARRKKAA